METESGRDTRKSSSPTSAASSSTLWCQVAWSSLQEHHWYMELWPAGVRETEQRLQHVDNENQAALWQVQKLQHHMAAMGSAARPRRTDCAAGSAVGW